jgi:NTP pyrophosphatase (non-canonical NTP hydrolase)
MENYQALAMRTESFKDELPEDKAFAMRFLHHAMGLVTESGEMMETQENLVEEIGDAFWYLAGMANTFEFQMVDFAIRNISSISDELNNVIISNSRGSKEIIDVEIKLLVIEAAQIMDCAKRYFFYGKPLDMPRAIRHISRYYTILCALVPYTGISVEEIQRRNIDKLRTRYPAKFDSDLAVNRDIAAEQKALEGKSN